MIVQSQGVLTTFHNFKSTTCVRWTKLLQFLQMLGEPDILHFTRNDAFFLLLLLFKLHSLINLSLRHLHLVIFWIDLLRLFFVIIIIRTNNVQSSTFEMFW